MKAKKQRSLRSFRPCAAGVYDGGPKGAVLSAAGKCPISTNRAEAAVTFPRTKQSRVGVELLELLIQLLRNLGVVTSLQ